MKMFFLHGLESSSHGTKGRFFKENFNTMVVPDFSGSLESRLQDLERLCGSADDILLVGSSFGGLMAACFAIAHPQRVKKLILMAPALNFPGFEPPLHPITTPTTLLIGSLDRITPADIVLPLAEKTFARLQIELVDEDHLLHQSFLRLDWKKLLFSGLNE